MTTGAHTELKLKRSRDMVLKFECIMDLSGDFKNNWCLDPTSRVSDSIGLGVPGHQHM